MVVLRNRSRLGETKWEKPMPGPAHGWHSFNQPHSFPVGAFLVHIWPPSQQVDARQTDRMLHFRFFFLDDRLQFTNPFREYNLFRADRLCPGRNPQRSVRRSSGLEMLDSLQKKF